MVRSKARREKLAGIARDFKHRSFRPPRWARCRYLGRAAAAWLRRRLPIARLRLRADGPDDSPCVLVVGHDPEMVERLVEVVSQGQEGWGAHGLVAHAPARADIDDVIQSFRAERDLHIIAFSIAANHILDFLAETSDEYAEKWRLRAAAVMSAPVKHRYPPDMSMSTPSPESSAVARLIRSFAHPRNPPAPHQSMPTRHAATNISNLSIPTFILNARDDTHLQDVKIGASAAPVKIVMHESGGHGVFFGEHGDVPGHLFASTELVAFLRHMHKNNKLDPDECGEDQYQQLEEPAPVLDPNMPTALDSKNSSSGGPCSSSTVPEPPSLSDEPENEVLEQNLSNSQDAGSNIELGFSTEKIPSSRSLGDSHAWNTVSDPARLGFTSMKPVALQKEIPDVDMRPSNTTTLDFPRSTPALSGVLRDRPQTCNQNDIPLVHEESNFKQVGLLKQPAEHEAQDETKHEAQSGELNPSEVMPTDQNCDQSDPVKAPDNNGTSRGGHSSSVNGSEERDVSSKDFADGGPKPMVSRDESAVSPPFEMLKSGDDQCVNPQNHPDTGSRETPKKNQPGNVDQPAAEIQSLPSVGGNAKTTGDQTGLVEHALENQLKAADDQPPQQTTTLPVFSCFLCPSSFPAQNSLINHFASFHPTVATGSDLAAFCQDPCCGSSHCPPSLSGPSMVHCAGSEVDVTTASPVRPSVSHGLLNGQCEFQCKVCGESFASAPQCETHITEVHRPEIVAGVCSLCSFSVDNYANLQYHYKFRHLLSNEKRPTCQHCRLVLSDSEALLKHTNLFHREKQPHDIIAGTGRTPVQQGEPRGEPKGEVDTFECVTCREMFNKASILVAHCEVRHPHAVPQCPCCRKVLQSHASLAAHVRRVHEVSRERSKCPHCPRSFAYPSSLKKHVRRFHEDFSVPANDSNFVRPLAPLPPPLGVPPPPYGVHVPDPFIMSGFGSPPQVSALTYGSTPPMPLYIPSTHPPPPHPYR